MAANEGPDGPYVVACSEQELRTQPAWDDDILWLPQTAGEESITERDLRRILCEPRVFPP
jgi:hypothetical protein